MDITNEIIKGLLLALLYFEITKANDTTFENVFSFATFYTIMIIGAYLVGMDLIIVTNAFVTKTIFTLIDERIKRSDETK